LWTALEVQAFRQIPAQASSRVILWFFAEAERLTIVGFYEAAPEAPAFAFIDDVPAAFRSQIRVYCVARGIFRCHSFSI